MSPFLTRYMPRFLQGPEGMLILMACAMAVSMNGWFALLNNFAVERASFTGKEIGFLQSIREIPGFMSFAAVLLLPFIREQNLAFLSLALLGIGTALTGYFPTEMGLYATTLIMSTGFHYYETMNQSLTLQVIDKQRAAVHLATQLKSASIGTLAVFLVIMICFDEKLMLMVQGFIGIENPFPGFNLGYKPLYLGAGLFTLAVAVYCKLAYPSVEASTQVKTLFLRPRYWLYYALTFMGGARRQIFMVFAAFLMVEKFGYDVTAITLLYMINLIANIFVAPYIGKYIRHLGERRALIFEYLGLICIFTGYAFVDDHIAAAGLYVLDHLFFAFAIAIKTYFQKIADPKDIASTAGVSFTINHIAAVGIPALFGFIWLGNPSLVFSIGAGMAVISLVLALLVPRDPEPGNETTLTRGGGTAVQPAE
ncbi:MFS transporter [Rhodospirillaceae bacterium KN72]|uniref:MFS transporter n=1 Tax=Pacificispira spongiicola TaxID=2729598 RepID=A0A7Y0HEU7_9PROT|nr:MFS transporter [Pacificispira spongiicola]NMM45246.1 MFS transporter [Pacificispira spongiicola]